MWGRSNEKADDFLTRLRKPQCSHKKQKDFSKEFQPIDTPQQ
jgi:hypothetical protein